MLKQVATEDMLMQEKIRKVKFLYAQGSSMALRPPVQYMKKCAQIAKKAYIAFA